MKMIQKILIIGLAIAGAVGVQTVRAGEMEIRPVDIKSFVGDMRASYLITGSGQKYSGLHIPLASYIGSKGEYFNINCGIKYQDINGRGSLMTGLGFRIDNLLSRMNIKKVITARLPTLELGPYLELSDGIFDKAFFKQIGLLVSYKIGGN